MPEVIGNLSNVKAAIIDAIKRVNDLKRDSEDTNAEKQAIRESLNALGIGKKAFDWALAYANMDPEKRVGHDLAYALVRECAGLPLQEDLFDAAARKANEPAPETSKAKGPDAGEIAKVISSQESEKTKGKKVLASNTGQGTIN